MRRILVALVIPVALASCRDEPQPMAGGKPLKHWKREAQQVSFMSFWNSSKDERRAEAFRRLSEIGEPAVPTLIELFRDEGIPVSGDAFNALANLGPRASAAVPALISIIREDKGRLRQRSAWILGTIGLAAEPSVATLATLLQDPDPRLREIAATALGQIGGSGSAALDSARRSGNAQMREAAVAGFRVAPLDTASRRDYIETALGDPDPQVRLRGVELLLTARRDDGEPLASYLVRGLSDSDPQVSEVARRVLTVHLQRGNASQALLAAVLDGADIESRARAAWQLGNNVSPASHSASSHSSETVAALRRALVHEDSRVRIYAARALAYAPGRARAEGLRVLDRELRTAEPILAVRAARVLWHVRRDAGEVKGAYEAGLRDSVSWNRVEAISAILELGPEAAAFIPLLEQMRSDPSPEVRERVEKALGSLRRMSAGRRTQD